MCVGVSRDGGGKDLFIWVISFNIFLFCFFVCVFFTFLYDIPSCQST